MPENDEKTNPQPSPAEINTLDSPSKRSADKRSSAYYRQPVMQTMELTAQRAAIILDDFINRRKGWTHLVPGLQKACEYVIDHAVGKSAIKVQHTGGELTYAQLSKAASTLDDKPRPVLAEVMEIAAHHAAEVVLDPPGGDVEPVSDQPDVEKKTIIDSLDAGADAEA